MFTLQESAINISRGVGTEKAGWRLQHWCDNAAEVYNDSLNTHTETINLFWTHQEICGAIW